MKTYAQSSVFPNAWKTQSWVLIFGGITLDSSSSYDSHRDDDVIREFRKADQDQWAEWVASNTPYGEEAYRLQNWQKDNFATTAEASRLVDGPTFFSRREGAAAIRDCILKVDLYFNPPKQTGKIMSWVEKIFGIG